MRREAQKRLCRYQQKAPVSDPVASSTTVHPTIPVVQPCSTARSRGRSRVRRDRAEAYRKITALEAKLEETKRLYERYRKWCQRQKKVGEFKTVSIHPVLQIIQCLLKMLLNDVNKLGTMSQV